MQCQDTPVWRLRAAAIAGKYRDALRAAAWPGACDAEGVAGSTVLICDDDRDHADALALGLHALGHAVELTRSRADAFAVACAFDVDVLVAGWTLRDGSALALPASLGIRRPSFVVLVSRIDEHLCMNAARRVGFDLQLTKVVDPAALDRLLRAERRNRETLQATACHLVDPVHG